MRMCCNLITGTLWMLLVGRAFTSVYWTPLRDTPLCASEGKRHSSSSIWPRDTSVLKLCRLEP